jgi:hypothetical protein
MSDDGQIEEWTLGNEFAVVRVTKITGRNGVWIEIVSPRHGNRRVRLDPTALETLTAFSPDEVTHLYRESMRRAHPDN